ncbi:transposase [Natrinema sp. J7-2]|nr:transposase [Natrinema sp. J7-2]
MGSVQLVGNAVPIVLDTRPVRKGDTRKEIVADLGLWKDPRSRR